MPSTTISAGMSVKRPGQEQYSSDGFHLTVEMEAEIENADHFRTVTQALFGEVKAALEAEVANGSAQTVGAASGVDLWSAGGNGANGGGNGRKAASRTASKPASRSNGRTVARTAPATTESREADSISNKQAKFLFQLARRAGMKTQAKVAGWIREKLGVEKGVYELSKVEASRAIDLLNNGNGGAKR